MVADMPVGRIWMPVIWQSPRVCGGGAPYLSICACVTHTCVVRGPPPKGDPGGACIPGGMGDCCQVMIEVISQRPGFLVVCAQAMTATAKRQQPNVIQTRVLRMISPV
jgi:hypothetical protein